jgi:hypothetical protein
MHDQASAAHRQEEILDRSGGLGVHTFEKCLHRIAQLAGTLSSRPENRDVAPVPQDGTSAWEGDSDGLARSLIGLINEKLSERFFVQAHGRVGTRPFTRVMACKPRPIRLGRAHGSESGTLTSVG